MCRHEYHHPGHRSRYFSTIYIICIIHNVQQFYVFTGANIYTYYIYTTIMADELIDTSLPYK